MFHCKICTAILILASPAMVMDALAQHEFPSGIQSLIDNQVPLGSGAIGELVPGFTDDIGSYFEFLDIQNGVSFNYVLCYHIGANSRHEEVALSSIESTPFTGILFVYCKASFDVSRLTSDPQFPVFLESIEPDVTLLNFRFAFDTVDIRFTDVDSFFAGYGEHCIQDFIPKLNCDTSRFEASLNNMTSNPLPLIFNLGGCAGAGADFSLPGVRYVDNGSGQAELEFEDSFDFSDPNFRLIFNQYSYCDEDGTLAEQTFEIPLFRTGDTNLDGEINLLDVAPFVDCITSGSYQFQCDMDQNLVVDLLDVEPFIAMLTAG